MARGNGDVKVTFKVFNQDFNKAMSQMEASAKKLRQELKLEQEQLKMSGSESQKLASVLNSLQKQYDIARQKTQAAAEQLEAVKRQFGENSEEAAKMENKLRSQQITEQQLANRIARTSAELEKARRAEAERASESAKAKQALSGLQREEEKLKLASQNLEKQYELEKSALSKNASETDKAKLRYTYLQAAQQAAAKETKNLEDQLRQAKTAFGEDSKEVKELEGKLLDAQRAEQNLAQESSTLGSKIGTPFKEAISRANDLGNKLKTVGSNLRDIGSNATMKISTPIVGGFALAVKSATSFEHQIADIRKELNNGSMSVKQLDKTMGEVSKNSLDWSQEFGVSTDTINEGILELVKNGYSVKEAQAIMRGSIEASIGANEKLEDVTNASTSALESYGLKTNDASQNIKNAAIVQDKFAAVANATKTSFTGLGEAFSVVGATAHSLNQPLSVTAAAIGELESNGVDASTAATALKSGMVNLVSPTKQMKNAMDSMGLSVFDANGKMKPLPDIIEQIEKGTAGWTAKQKEQALATLFGKESLASWNILVNHGSKELNDLAKEADNSSGAVKRMANQMKHTPQNQFKQLKEALHGLAVEFGEEVLPSIIPVIQKVKDLIHWFAGLSSGTKKTIAAIAAIAAVFGPVIVIIGTLISSIGSIIGVITAVAGAFSVVGGTLTLTIGSMSVAFLPFLGVIAAVVAAIIGIILVIKNWGAIWGWLKSVISGFASWIGGVWQGIKNITETVWNAIKQFLVNWWPVLLGALAGPVGLIAGLIYKNWGMIKAVTETVWGAISQWLGGLWQGIVNTASTIWQGLVNVFTFVFLLVKEVISAAWTVISSLLIAAWRIIVALTAPIWQPVAAFFSSLWGEIKNVASSVWNNLKTFFTTIWNAIVLAAKIIFNPIKTFFSTVWNAVKTISSSVWNSIKSVISKVWGGIKSVVQSAANAVKSIVSAGWNKVKSISSTVWNGVKSVITAVWKAIKSLVSTYINNVKSNVTSVWNGIKSITSSIWNGIKSVISRVWSSIKSAVSTPLNWIRSRVSSVWNSIRSTTSSVWNRIKSAITSPINSAKNTVGRIVRSIKGFFANMHLRIPRISLPPLPHFHLSGHFSLKPPSVPHLSVDWYKNGGIFNDASIIGIGEAGREAALPLVGHAMDPFADAVANRMLSTLPQVAQSQMAQNVTNNNKIVMYNTVRNDKDIDKIAEKVDEVMGGIGNRRAAAWGGANG